MSSLQRRLWMVRAEPPTPTFVVLRTDKQTDAQAVRVSGSASTLAQLCLAGKAAGLGWPVVRTCLRGPRVLNRREGLHPPQNAAASESFHARSTRRVP